METLLVKLATKLVLPPGANFVVALGGLLLLPRRRRTGLALLWFAALSLLVLSVPVTSSLALRRLESFSAVTADDPRVRSAGAIVVLTGGRWDAVEYGGDTVSDLTLVRLRYAARLHRSTGLPLLVSGGSTGGQPVAEAALARDVLRHEFGVSVRWVETRSRNTAENARESAKLLRSHGVRRVVLVTHALHMARAVEAFRERGTEVVPAPTAFRFDSGDDIGPDDLLPSPWTLARSAWGLYQIYGRIWYRIRY